MRPTLRRPARRASVPLASVEPLEGRRLPAAIGPQIAVADASTPDSKDVVVDYSVSGQDLHQNFNIDVYRSAGDKLDASAVPVASLTVVASGAGSGAATLDLAGAPAADVGAHRLAIAVPGGLPPDPSHPNILVVADPTGALGAADTSYNTAVIHTHVIGVVTHGGIQPKEWVQGPPWERRMAAEMRAEGYDAVVAFNWVYDSHHPGAAARQGPRLAAMIRSVAARFPASDPVDLDLIGHSEGAIVNSVALAGLEGTMPANLSAGYVTMTMLDPHAANTGAPGPQYSVSKGLVGRIAKMTIDHYQSQARDPLAFVPARVDRAEVFYQHTPIRQATGSNDGIYNLWGQVPVRGRASYYNLTGPGISHAGKFGVFDWYRLNVVPTLAGGDTLAASNALAGARTDATPGTATPTYSGTAAPGATVRLIVERVGSSKAVRVGQSVAGPGGSWSIAARPLAPGRYRVEAVASPPANPATGRTLHMIPTALLPTLVVTPSGVRGG